MKRMSPVPINSQLHISIAGLWMRSRGSPDPAANSGKASSAFLRAGDYPPRSLQNESESGKLQKNKRMYEHSTAYYDLIYRDLKDYAGEAARIHSILERLDPRPRKLLDVACGTGEHARQLQETYGYQVDGIDIQPGFVSIAAAKSPRSEFTRADMRDFQLEQAYDALLCLFSSIGYVQTVEGLSDALACMSRHLKPKGWIVIEPWLTPDLWIPGQVDQTEARDPETGTKILRTRKGSSQGSNSIMEIQYELTDAGGGMRKFSETHRLGLFHDEQIEQVLNDLDMDFKWLPLGLQSERLLLALKSR